MYIERIKQITKYKAKIFTEERIFSLSYKNIMKYGLREDMELSAELYEEIRRDVMLPSAKRKAMDLLLRSDQSEKELKRKLALKDFDEETIEEAIDYVKKFNYINDERYAENYVNYRSRGKSKRQLKMELERKGIEKERVEELISETVDERETIDQLIRKKVGNKKEFSIEERKKLMAFLYRRGFEGELIQSRMREVLGESGKREYEC